MKKLHKSPTQITPRIVKRILPTTAIASGLLAQPAFAAPGDLDPTFSDMGRASFPLKGPAFRVQNLSRMEVLSRAGSLSFIALVATTTTTFAPPTTASLEKCLLRARSIWSLRPPCWPGRKSWTSRYNLTARSLPWAK